jgi:hypothetical protein
MTMVAVCTDETAPAEASAFSSCTTVAWTDASNVAPGIFDGLTMESVAPVALAIMVLWASAFAIRVITDQVRSA